MLHDLNKCILNLAVQKKKYRSCEERQLYSSRKLFRKWLRPINRMMLGKTILSTAKVLVCQSYPLHLLLFSFCKCLQTKMGNCVGHRSRVTSIPPTPTRKFLHTVISYDYTKFDRLEKKNLATTSKLSTAHLLLLLFCFFGIWYFGYFGFGIFWHLVFGIVLFLWYFRIRNFQLVYF